MDKEPKSRRLLKKAKKLEKRKMRSEMYRRYFLQYNSIEPSSADDFTRKLNDENTNVIPFKRKTRKKVQPAMPVATHLTLFKERLLHVAGAK